VLIADRTIGLHYIGWVLKTSDILEQLRLRESVVCRLDLLCTVEACRGKEKIKKKEKNTLKMLVLSALLTPFSFSVTFFTLWPSPFCILLQIKETENA
jgi:hypothetical protein